MVDPRCFVNCIYALPLEVLYRSFVTKGPKAQLQMNISRPSRCLPIKTAPSDPRPCRAALFDPVQLVRHEEEAMFAPSSGKRTASIRLSGWIGRVSGDRHRPNESGEIWRIAVAPQANCSNFSVCAVQRTARDLSESISSERPDLLGLSLFRMKPLRDQTREQNLAEGAHAYCTFPNRRRSVLKIHSAKKVAAPPPIPHCYSWLRTSGIRIIGGRDIELLDLAERRTLGVNLHHAATFVSFSNTASCHQSNAAQADFAMSSSSSYLELLHPAKDGRNPSCNSLPT
ncbi:hypothetical protein BIW11_03106 [Tropilaelaps mercedesae]|uniref:Uncharacterized protein n=1 Tax=Tropilaelaps mercedesae TaxID=418985 RepID=A0A1V9XS10_9ACAR|nr:hypothetical protein BIW11_03106 [Tropilaelaps mercedesae]